MTATERAADDVMTLDAFGGRVDDVFRLELEDEAALPLVLVEAAALPVHTGRDGAAPSREPFSLLFRGAESPVLPQRIYRLDNDEMGALDIFLVPVDRTSDGTFYEAVFN